MEDDGGIEDGHGAGYTIIIFDSRTPIHFPRSPRERQRFRGRAGLPPARLAAPRRRRQIRSSALAIRPNALFFGFKLGPWSFSTTPIARVGRRPPDSRCGRPEPRRRSHVAAWRCAGHQAMRPWRLVVVDRGHKGRLTRGSKVFLGRWKRQTAAPRPLPAAGPARTPHAVHRQHRRRGRSPGRRGRRRHHPGQQHRKFAFLCGRNIGAPRSAGPRPDWRPLPRARPCAPREGAMGKRCRLISHYECTVKFIT